MERKFGLGQKGFTLIELLIVVAVLGALLAVAVPMVGSFMENAKVTAANVEVATVQVACVTYLAEHHKFPESSEDLNEGYVGGQLKGTYTFNNNGLITSATGWDNMEFETDIQQWVKK